MQTRVCWDLACSTSCNSRVWLAGFFESPASPRAACSTKETIKAALGPVSPTFEMSPSLR
jgi:hypothetical protein